MLETGTAAVAEVISKVAQGHHCYLTSNALILHCSRNTCLCFSERYCKCPWAVLQFGYDGWYDSLRTVLIYRYFSRYRRMNGFHWSNSTTYSITSSAVRNSTGH